MDGLSRDIPQLFALVFPWVKVMDNVDVVNCNTFPFHQRNFVKDTGHKLAQVQHF